MNEFDAELRVLVVAADALARAGLAALLAEEPGILVAGQSAPDVDWDDLLAAYRPDAVVWDWGWDPAAALGQLPNADAPDVPVVALLPDEDAAAEAWGAGIHGLLPRQAAPEQIVAALRAVAAGVAALDPALVEALVAPRGAPLDAPGTLLTPREAEVLRLLAEGLANKAIAQRLDISEHTVKFHVNAILRKLDAQSRTEAVIEATRRGLILL